MTIRILTGDCRERLKDLDDNSVDSCVCDPPYHLTSIVKRFGSTNAAPAKVGKTGAYARASAGFMGQQWDGGDVAFDPDTWREVFRVLKPGAHLVAFSGTRTYHRMACAIEDSGFEIRDQLAWTYGSGFPKSHDVSKAIDKMAGAEREKLGTMPDRWTGAGAVLNFATDRPQEEVVVLGGPATQEAAGWEGWGTALKPAWEPICLARKPLIGTVAANVLEHGTGALNIDGCRIEADGRPLRIPGQRSGFADVGVSAGSAAAGETDLGRWPANIIHDGSEEVLAGFPDTESGTGAVKRATAAGYQGNALGKESRPVGTPMVEYGDSGSAARFFYCAKADSAERHAGCEDLEKGNNHPTVKPVDLMRWLCRLVTPKGGTVLDPFMGSGSTMIAADAEQFHGVGCELSPEYSAIAERRIRAAGGMFAEVLAA